MGEDVCHILTDPSSEDNSENEDSIEPGVVIRILKNGMIPTATFTPPSRRNYLVQENTVKYFLMLRSDKHTLACGLEIQTNPRDDAKS